MMSTRATDDTRVGIIGAGRFGCSLAVAMHDSGYRMAAVSSRSPESARALAQRMPGCEALESAQDVADAADTVFITSPDGAVEDVARSIRWSPRQAVIHCSGALPLDTLLSAREAGAHTGALHIFQTFPDRDRARNIPGSACAIAATDEPLFEWLEGLADDLGGRPFRIRDEQRAAYHASAIMACGLLATLMGLAASLWEQAGLTDADSLDAVRQIASATVEAVGEKGLPEALTGPFVRGDTGTIAMHLEALSSSPQTAHVYAALALAGMPLYRSGAGGSALSEEAAAEMAKMLESVLTADASARRVREGGPDGQE